MTRVVLARVIHETGACPGHGSWAMRCAPIQVTQYANRPRVQAGLPVDSTGHALAICRRHGIRFRGGIIAPRTRNVPIGHIAAFLIS